MTYKVIYSPSVRADIREHVQYLVDQHVSAETIERWYVPLFKSIDNLYTMPRLYPVDEPASKKHGGEVHKLTYKNYRVCYSIDDDARIVYVFSFMHGRRIKEEG